MNRTKLYGDCQRRRVPHLRRSAVNRRDALAIGALTALGLGAPDVLRRRAAAEDAVRPAPPPRAKSCILVWLDGGPSHLETFDPKPDAPQEVRGPFGTVSTAVPGVAVCDLLPNTAAILGDAALVRSVTSPLGEHNFGTHYLLTGYKPTPVLEYPAFGAVAAHVRTGRSVLPPFVAVPDHRVGGAKFSGRGFLPESAGPFEVGDDPARQGFQVRDLDFYPGVTSRRIDRRREFLQALDRRGRSLDANPQAPGDAGFEQAYRLVTSAEAKRAFDVDEEPAALRDRYGRKTKMAGQSCLLARRLVERGVPFVTVNNRGWDTHADAVTRLRDGYTGAQTPVGLIPSLDLAVSALIGDLKERGMLDETLVVVMGEFGRTPKLNTQGGRDHWPRVFSVLVAGGGVRGGQVLGASDAAGESPAERPVTPAELAATIYTLLGIDPSRELHTSDGRPVRIADGPVIEELIG
ncbi:MAG: DUF1501 domain-containing protein [Planctomycetes bacterium]|nr:DUF1501 domain-containing protein [Planctomycetota bacterium]